jgi:hypothetical protein
MKPTAIVGALLAGVAGALFGLLRGGGEAMAAVAAGALATGIQVLAVRYLRQGFGGTTAQFYKGVGLGMGLRMAGLVTVMAAVALDRATFPPLPTAFGFLGVLIPLLFLEVRFVR